MLGVSPQKAADSVVKNERDYSDGKAVGKEFTGDGAMLCASMETVFIFLGDLLRTNLEPRSE